MTTDIKQDHIALIVSDLERSARFYRHLGGTVVSKPSEQFLEVIVGELRLHLVRARDPGATGAPAPLRIDHICLQVPSRRALEHLLELVNDSESAAAHGPYRIQESPPLGPGATHCEQRPPLATLYFRDPDGIGLEARCYP